MAPPTAKWSGVVVDICLVVTFGLASALVRQFAVPFHRGFFRDDESLMHPYKESTIPAVALYCYSLILPCLCVAFLEAAAFKKSLTQIMQSRHTQRGWREAVVRVWLWRVFKILLVFFFGHNVVNLSTNIMKYSVGRLRPHFLHVCQPDFSRVNKSISSIGCFGPYLTAETVCTGDKALIQEARLSFPSGHSSISVYCMVFLVLYLEVRFKWTHVLLLKSTLQTVVLFLAIYTGCSRISDYKHHWSDVLGGAILGVIVAVLVVASLKESCFPQPPKQQLSREDSLLEFLCPDHDSVKDIAMEDTAIKTRGSVQGEITSF